MWEPVFLQQEPTEGSYTLWLWGVVWTNWEQDESLGFTLDSQNDSQSHRPYPPHLICYWQNRQKPFACSSPPSMTPNRGCFICCRSLTHCLSDNAPRPSHFLQAVSCSVYWQAVSEVTYSLVCVKQFIIRAMNALCTQVTISGAVKLQQKKKV